jgi:hypothetical protein
MNNAKEKQEGFFEQSSKLKTADTKRCYQCNGGFGLIRRKYALKHFCSTRCLEKFKDTERKISLIKEWRDYFAKKR